MTDFPAIGLAEELTFSDPLGPLDTGIEVLSYALQIRFLGRRGPVGAPVQAFRVVAPPPEPPAFSVDLFGIDFYGRTVVQITLDEPVPGERFTVWAADGRAAGAEPSPFAWKPGSSFRDHAVRGEYPAQQPINGRVLFDSLALPIPSGAARPVTFGLRREARGGAVSDYTTREEMLQLATPP